MKLSGNTHTGLVRTNNEDSFYIKAISKDVALAVVADGVGGQEAGEVASGMTCDVFRNLAEAGTLDMVVDDVSYRGPILTTAAIKAHNNVVEDAQTNGNRVGMASTLTVVIADRETGVLAQVGDSRLYHFSDGTLTQISVDQSLAQRMLDAGEISEAEAAEHPQRHVLVQAIGADAVDQEWEPIITEFSWQAGDTLLLCSDGLTDMVSDDDIAAILAKGSRVERLNKALIKAALKGGGKDNTTVVLLRND